MIDEKRDNLEKAFELLESGVSLEKIFVMFPKEKKEIQEINSLINFLQKEKQTIKAPKEILKKIFEKNDLSSEEPGRFFGLETFNNLITNLNFMNQKSKLIIPAVGIIAFLVVGVILFSFSKDNSEIATSPIVSETAIVTTSSVIGDKSIDESINAVLNDALSENDLNSEFEDIELALSDEEEFDQINNLFNDNEL